MRGGEGDERRGGWEEEEKRRKRAENIENHKPLITIDQTIGFTPTQLSYGRPAAVVNLAGLTAD